MESRSRNVGALVLGLALLFGCKESGPSSASANTASAKPSTTSASAGTGSAATSAAAAPSGSADAGKADAVDVSDILNDKSEDNAGVLSVDLSQVKEDAPPLGGAAPAPPPAQTGKELEWVPVGPLMFVQPGGWQKKKINNDIGLFVSGDNKAGIAFSHFDTPANGEQRVNAMTQTFGFKEVKWSKSKQVKVGLDSKFPAIVRGGTGKDAKGKPMKLFFALIKTGQQMNIVALGGADTDAPEETMKLPLMIVATPKAAAAPAGQPKK